MADPKFQFSRRWAEITPRLLSEDSSERAAAVTDLEMNMRDLEDAWPSGGGGTAQSILAVGFGSGSHDDSGSSGRGDVYSTVAFTVPSDPGFNYYVNWNIHGSLQLIGGLASTVDFGGYAQIAEHSPGAGFELWGWRYSTADYGGTTESVDRLTGHGHRIEDVTGLTTATLAVTIGSAVGTPQRLLNTYGYSAMLIAVPV